jgi:hypothetical protein
MARSIFCNLLIWLVVALTTISQAQAAKDTTPNAFSFTDQTGIALSTLVTSNQITVTGINSAASISVTGGKYSKNGGAFTSSSGTVNNNDTVKVQQTSSASYNTITNTVLTIGGVKDTFSVTTLNGAASCSFLIL